MARRAALIILLSSRRGFAQEPRQVTGRCAGYDEHPHAHPGPSRRATCGVGSVTAAAIYRRFSAGGDSTARRVPNSSEQFALKPFGDGKSVFPE